MLPGAQTLGGFSHSAAPYRPGYEHAAHGPQSEPSVWWVQPGSNGHNGSLFMQLYQMPGQGGGLHTPGTTHSLEQVKACLTRLLGKHGRKLSVAQLPDEYKRAFGTSLPQALGCVEPVGGGSAAALALQALVAVLRVQLADTVVVKFRINGALEVELLHDTQTGTQPTAGTGVEQQQNGAHQQSIDGIARVVGNDAVDVPPGAWWASANTAGVAPRNGSAAVGAPVQWAQSSFAPASNGYADHGPPVPQQNIGSNGSSGSGNAQTQPAAANEPKSRQGVPMDARLYVTWRSQVTTPSATPNARPELVPTLRPDDLWEFFKQFGEVAFCDVHGQRSPPPGSSAASRRHGMPGAGYAFVGFAEPGGCAAAQNVLQSPSHSFRGAEIRAKLWRAGSNKTDSNNNNNNSNQQQTQSQPQQRQVPAPTAMVNGNAVHKHQPHNNHNSGGAPSPPNSDTDAALAHELQAVLALDAMQSVQPPKPWGGHGAVASAHGGDMWAPPSRPPSSASWMSTAQAAHPWSR